MDQQHVESETKQSVIKLKLVPAQSTDDSTGNVIASLVVVNETTNGGASDAGVLPYIDEAVTTISVNPLQNVVQGKELKPRLRYYAVGPSTYNVKCPLCQQKANACVMRGAGCKDVTCCLSLLSCIFPIFWLCCLCTWCGCNSEWHTKGLYCSQCGGKLGQLRKPK